MGLTIHYGLTSETRSTAKAKTLSSVCGNLPLICPLSPSMSKFAYSVLTCANSPLDDLRQDDQIVFRCPGRLQHVPVPWHRNSLAA